MGLKGVYVFVGILYAVSAFAQADSTELDLYVIENPDYVIPFSSLSTKDKMHYSFGMGVGFGNDTYGDYFSTYYQPKLSYDVSPKLKINAGLTYVNTMLLLEVNTKYLIDGPLEVLFFMTLRHTMH